MLTKLASPTSLVCSCTQVSLVPRYHRAKPYNLGTHTTPESVMLLHPHPSHPLKRPTTTSDFAEPATAETHPHTVCRESVDGLPLTNNSQIVLDVRSSLEARINTACQ